MYDILINSSFCPEAISAKRKICAKAQRDREKLK